MLAEERDGGMERNSYGRPLHLVVEAVAAPANRDQAVFDPSTRERLRHEQGLLVGHIRVLVAM